MRIEQAIDTARLEAVERFAKRSGDHARKQAERATGGLRERLEHAATALRWVEEGARQDLGKRRPEE